MKSRKLKRNLNKSKDFKYNGDTLKADRIKHYKKNTLYTKTWRSNYPKYYTSLAASLGDTHLDIKTEAPVYTSGGPLFNFQSLENINGTYIGLERSLKTDILNQIPISYKNVHKGCISVDDLADLGETVVRIAENKLSEGYFQDLPFSVKYMS